MILVGVSIMPVERVMIIHRMLLFLLLTSHQILHEETVSGNICPHRHPLLAKGKTKHSE